MCVVWNRKGVIWIRVLPLAIITPIVRRRLFFQPLYATHCSSTAIVPDWLKALRNRNDPANEIVSIPRGLKMKD
jgi:hypothetical protein